MYYWINTSLEYQATNEHFDCIVVSQNICIRDYQQIDMFFLHYSVLIHDFPLCYNYSYYTIIGDFFQCIFVHLLILLILYSLNNKYCVITTIESEGE